MHRRFSAALLLLVLAAGVRAPAADVPNDAASVTHALQRLTYGVRPGDVERVRREGLAAWIDRQLTPAPAESGAQAPAEQAETRRADAATRREMRRAARRAIDDLAAAKLARAVTSERQLEEILADLWFNHFNVNGAKGRTALYLASYERDAIRPHVLGRFRDLLGATAHHPAMLFYLDNVRSRAGNVNENYARELLELHTLGVDGGYTQQDVEAVARAFTGWTIGRQANGFRFARAMHDTAPKVVLGQAIRGGGEQDGERVLDLFAAHPSTARHIARKLARRFVSDTPPEPLVARAAQRFRETNGDLREVVRAIVTAPEFFAPEVRNAKVKTPLELVVSALRLKAEATESFRLKAEATGVKAEATGVKAEATGVKAEATGVKAEATGVKAEATGVKAEATRAALRALRELGMPLYRCQPPTGYDDSAETWVTSGALVARVDFAARMGVAVTPEFQKR